MWNTSKRAQRGSTLIVVLGGTVVAAACLLALIQSSGGSQKATTQFIDDQGVYYAAQGATELALSEVWGAYKTRVATYPNLDFQTYLNYRFAWETIPAGVDPMADQMRVGQQDVKRAIVTDWGNLKLGNRIVSKFNIYQRARNEVYPGTTVVKQYNYDLMIAAESQKDLGYRSASEQLAALGASSPVGAATAVKSLGQSTNSNANWVAQYMTFSNPPEYKGLEYGVLAKNMECMLCHMRVSTVAKAFNKDPSKLNSFPKAKVGSTSLLSISSGADVLIDGSLYQRGRLEDDASASLINANSAASRLRSSVLNADGTIKQSVVLNANGTINASASGSTTTVYDTNTPSVAMTGSTPVPGVNGNFYANYPTDPGQQSDGVLPSNDFPSPFPDLPRTEDSNRPNHKIDADEVALARANAVAASDPAQPGSIQGGIAVTLAPGTQYTQTSLPNAGTAANITTGYTGNLILTGTASNPIQLDGKVVIDGDVIIRGYVQGTGQIFTSGNIYIPGDIIYKDRTDMVPIPGQSPVAQEAFGADSQNKPNLLGLVAGKNIIVGDYLSQVTSYDQGYTNGSVSSANKEFFAPRTVDSNNNVIVKQGQPEPGRILTWDADKYLNPSQVTVMPKTVHAPDGKTYSAYSQPNFTMFQLAQFNQMEYVKTLSSLPDYSNSNPYDPTNASRYRVPNTVANNPNDPYDPSYIPRFYSFYSYDATNPKTNPVYVTTTSAAQSPDMGGNGAPWSTTEQRFQLKRHSADPVALTDLADIPATVQSPASLTKKAVLNIHPDWVSPDTMMKIISSEELTRQTGSRRIDGLLYTNNALLAIERKLVQVYDPASNKWSNAFSRGNGNLTINGAAVAPDMGVMTPQGMFSVNYDQRVASLVKLQSSTSSSSGNALPANWGMVKKGFTKNVGSMPDSPRISVTNTTAAGY